MANLEIIEVEGIEHAIIDHGNGEFTSMTKAHYDEMIAAQEAQIEAKAK
jgi:hypothetical protein